MRTYSDKELKDILNIANNIAIKAHVGQVDKTGKPYFQHALAVSKRCKTLEGKIVGFLHDVLEDCPSWSPTMLIESGIPAYLVEVVQILTHSKKETYDDYIDRIMINRIAVEVKISDLKHNMDLSRNKVGLTDKDIERTLKYHRNYVKLYKYLQEND